MKELQKSDYKKVIDYIGDQYIHCAYLYMDFKEYAFSNPNVKVWGEEKENDQFSLIALQYYDCLHFYSRDNDFSVADMIALIHSVVPNVIFMPQKTMITIGRALQDEYDCEYTVLHTQGDYIKNYDLSEVQRATKDDLAEAAALIARDTIYTSTYTADSLCRQLMERMDHNFTRAFIIRRDNKVIAFICTAAEDDKIAFTGPLVVDPNYRGESLGKKMVAYNYNNLLNDGKLAISIFNNEISRQLHYSLGAVPIGIVARLQRKGD